MARVKKKVKICLSILLLILQQSAAASLFLLFVNLGKLNI
jgi:hypothetical protein